MKIKGFFVLLMLAGCGLMANAVGQTIFPPNIGPLTFVLIGSSGKFQVTNINRTIGLLHGYGSLNRHDGRRDDYAKNQRRQRGKLVQLLYRAFQTLGSGGSASQTITLAGTQLSRSSVSTVQDRLRGCA